jgi:hypothetical protein
MTGERYRRWEPPESHRVALAVCALCEPEAGRAGWVRAGAGAERQGAQAPSSTVRLVA